ncbi:hypothetical protein PUN28_013331 [Cardiocondyla obscurior]|uniref:Uncharacterized protein n=1 Tax=Cardiocondyla obscurior TaxID=286306 RepID=A0AAW2FC06_9HYME
MIVKKKKSIKRVSTYICHCTEIGVVIEKTREKIMGLFSPSILGGSQQPALRGILTMIFARRSTHVTIGSYVNRLRRGKCHICFSVYTAPTCLRDTRIESVRFIIN